MAFGCRRAWSSVLIGVVLGFTVASWLLVPWVTELGGKTRKSSLCPPYSFGRVEKTHRISTPSNNWHASQIRPQSSHEDQTSFEESSDQMSRPKRFLYVGVMTAKKYLDSRAMAAYKTWTSSIPGKVEFFSSQGSDTVTLSGPLPMVSLPGVDDSYPPQKKSFMMLKYMHDHYLDKFEWFMRADDDVYIQGDGAKQRFLEIAYSWAFVPGVRHFLPKAFSKCLL